MAHEPHHQHHAHPHAKAHAEPTVEAPEADAGSSIKFSSAGAVPAVAGGNGTVQVSASDRAFDDETATAKPHHNASAQMARLLAVAARAVRQAL